MSECENDLCIDCESPHLIRKKAVIKRNDDDEIFEITHRLQCQDCGKIFHIIEDI